MTKNMDTHALSGQLSWHPRAAGVAAVLLFSCVITLPGNAADSAKPRTHAPSKHAATHSRTAQKSPVVQPGDRCAYEPETRHVPESRGSHARATQYANGAACERSGSGARVSGKSGASAAARSKTQARQAPKRRLIGVASYYGPGFVNRPTANGERFDPRAMTAAHRTLPFGTRVRVTNLENGRQVVVRINDRGPYRKGRVIDLSRAAARRLGFVEDGVTNVRIEVLKEKKARRERLADGMQASPESTTRTRSKARA